MQRPSWALIRVGSGTATTCCPLLNSEYTLDGEVPKPGPERLRRPQRLALRKLTQTVSDFVLRGCYARETVDWAGGEDADSICERLLGRIS